MRNLLQVAVSATLVKSCGGCLMAAHQAVPVTAVRHKMKSSRFILLMKTVTAAAVLMKTVTAMLMKTVTAVRQKMKTRAVMMKTMAAVLMKTMTAMLMKTMAAVLMKTITAKTCSSFAQRNGLAETAKTCS